MIFPINEIITINIVPKIVPKLKLMPLNLVYCKAHARFGFFKVYLRANYVHQMTFINNYLYALNPINLVGGGGQVKSEQKLRPAAAAFHTHPKSVRIWNFVSVQGFLNFAPRQVRYFYRIHFFIYHLSFNIEIPIHSFKTQSSNHSIIQNSIIQIPIHSFKTQSSNHSIIQNPIIQSSKTKYGHSCRFS